MADVREPDGQGDPGHAAVAAAVHDAVGVRVRDLPILPWKVLAG
jgi:CO/xanthine dehydrogenase Mo-binding subunit